MGDSAPTITSKQSLILDLPPSCIEFCSIHPSYFVVSTYNLVKEEEANTESFGNADVAVPKKPQNRNGSLIVYRLVDGLVQHVQTLLHPSAILDLHFCSSSGREDILAVVSSTGTLSIFNLAPDTDDAEPLKHLATSRISDVPEGVLFLSGVWDPNNAASIALTTSSGEVRIVKLGDSWEIVNEEDSEAIITHSLEAWTVAFSPPDQTTPFILYSGGDDSALRYTSCSRNEDAGIEALYAPLNIPDHGAGVTAILPIPLTLADNARLLVTGSYDDTIRVFSVQPPHETYGMRKVRCLAEENLGGGVWRLKLIDMKSNADRCRLRVLASCMHAGARVVELEGPLSGEDWAVTVLAQFEEHKSMNYGSDFVPAPESKRLECVSTSFYDKLLCLWEVELA
ncbi:WD-40 repeat-containing protein [Colletotrichum scovillei]|uniref:methylated diphthine methylhydrolase n=1 Tax=Colletotrichum scovillei TaxID=1209932 RepID=A0A9P7QWN3_9PEZI|nr:WD-40 repeat-containing protein [Colletotrichum scovillei]